MEDESEAAGIADNENGDIIGDGAGGAHNFLFFETRTALNFFIFHFFSPKTFKHPTIDLTCCCKKDLDLNFITIKFLLFFTLT